MSNQAMITKQTVRDHFGLGQQRWSTVARIAKFRRLLGPGENPRNLERILKDLYILRNDALGTASMRRSLTANARVARETAERVKREASIEKTRAAREDRKRRRVRRREQLDEYLDTQHFNRQGDSTVDYVWHLDSPIFLFEKTGRNYRVIHEMRARLRHLLTIIDGGTKYIRLILGNTDLSADAEGEAISTPFNSSASRALSILADKIEELENQYEVNEEEGAFVMERLFIQVRRPNEENAAASQIRRTKANDVWLVPGEFNTQTNCFYVSWCMLQKPLEFLEGYTGWLEGSTTKYPDFNEQAKSKKKETRRALKISEESMVNSFTDDEMARRIVEHSRPKRTLKIYDGQFKLLEEMKPACKTEKAAKRLKESDVVIELQRSENHYRPLFRWDTIPDELADRIRKALTSRAPDHKQLKTAQPIIKHFQGEDTRNRRMISWDLEATTDADSQFKCYAVGMAWYRSVYDNSLEPVGCTAYMDGDQEMLYMSWWGLDALQKMIEFVVAYQKYFAESTFYAHNGGKFDLPMLLREHLFQFDGAIIEGEKCTILNGRWIGFQVLFLEHETRIYFRDSLALLAGSLDKLTKEYNVPHLKLAETVSHDDITLDNWHTFDALPLYLTHDCLGLLELLDRFGAEIFEVSYTEVVEKNKCERNVANILEALLGLPHMSFRKQRPEWLKVEAPEGSRKKSKRLELDGYCEEVGVAFEYQGEQHYDKNHCYHKKPGDFEILQANDAAKVRLCADNGVRLVVVPCSVRSTQLVKFIKDALSKLGMDFHADLALTNDVITQRRILDTGAISITSVMTAAGLAKRIYYNKFYGKFQLFTLTKKQDRYIRDLSYFGGRVELFHLGVINGLVYYLDFTSLYPAMGFKHEMPYGVPEWWSTFDPPSPDEVMGFGKKHANKTRAEVIETDQNYCQWALCQRNPHVGLKVFTRLLRSSFGPEWARETNPKVLPPEFFGWVRCRVRSTAEGKKRIPLHGVKSASGDQLPTSANGKLLFPHLDDWRELTLFSEEVRLGEKENLYEYEPIDGISFRRGMVLRDTFNSLFAMKAQAKAEGKSAKEKAVKIIANSTYGFFGQRTEGRESLKIYRSGDVPVYDYLSRNALIEEADHGRYTVLRVVEDMDLKDFNVGVAAATTSYARMRLWKLMDAIVQLGGKIYSCDTDSITTDLDISKYPSLLNEFIPDWQTDSPGAALGSLKCECTDEVQKVIKKTATLCESSINLPEKVRKDVAVRIQMARERDSITWKPMPFHHSGGSLCNGANKLYILRTQLKTGKVIEIAKAKGMTKYDKNGHPLFAWNDYEAMHHPTDPKPLTCTQTQFKLGMSGYCRDGDGIKPITIHKIPKDAHARYDKGNLQSDGRIVPWLI